MTVGPGDANPWNLPVSLDPADWGVTPARAAERFDALQALAKPDRRLDLEILRANTIAFGLYEDALTQLIQGSAVVGIAYDLAHVEELAGRLRPPKRAHHLARLTPIGEERRSDLSILSPAFDLDYPGSVRLFDDSGELEPAQQEVSWRDLVESFRATNGAYWAVRPTGVPSGPK